jgi:CRP/FNR family cyclic AMP-dependent transcriptional regulator
MAARAGHAAVVHFRANETVFAQGDPSAAVMYIRTGRVRLVTSRSGREVVVAMLHAGSFFGEGALGGQRRRRATARAMTAATITIVKTGEMRRRLHDETALSDSFRAHLLARNIRIEADLVDESLKGAERQLARLLLVLANFDEHQRTRASLPIISRDLLAQTIGTTRAKVDRLMNGFRKRGFLERHSEREGGLQVHRSMVELILQE